MPLSFWIIASLIVLSAIAAMSLRNLVHCALCLTLTFVGLAALYLQLDAQFVGFVQILVYVGAVAILIVFAILLTRNSEQAPEVAVVSKSWWTGLLVAVLVFGSVAAAITSSSSVKRSLPPKPEVTVKQIGTQMLMSGEQIKRTVKNSPSKYILPLEVMALLLTAAMIGGVIIAMQEKGAKR